MTGREELESLKAQWVADPCWDIEHTEGFEDQHNELLRFRLAKEAEWERERVAEIMEKAHKLACSPAMAKHILWLETRLDQMNDLLYKVYGSSHDHERD